MIEYDADYTFLHESVVSIMVVTHLDDQHLHRVMLITADGFETFSYRSGPEIQERIACG